MLINKISPKLSQGDKERFSITFENCFSDECLFHTNGTLKQHNARIWSIENPQAVEEVPMSSEKVMVWCKMHMTKTIESYYSRRSSVDSVAYKSMVRYYGLQHVQQLAGTPILQYDSATVHNANTVKEYLSRKLGNDWISREPIDWPTRSPV